METHVHDINVAKELMKMREFEMDRRVNEEKSFIY